jgi:hypothetical protein
VHTVLHLEVHKRSTPPQKHVRLIIDSVAMALQAAGANTAFDFTPGVVAHDLLLVAAALAFSGPEASKSYYRADPAIAFS